MVIGIAGKQGSGKDTVGEIIQYLYSKKMIAITTPDTEKEFLEFRNSSYKPLSHHFQIKKFADKLKDIVCILLNCTRGQLEDREFKEKKLGKTWNKWKVITQYETRYFSTEEEALAAYGSYYKPTLVEITPRYLLQIIGTEAGRDLIHPDIWVNSLFAEYISEKLNWVVTDVRFPNEVERIKQEKGVVVKLERPENKVNHTHYSEIALDDYKNWDYIVDNNKLIEDLIKKVRSILINEKII